MSQQLPPSPNLRRLKNEAKRLLKQWSAVEPAALHELRLHHPSFELLTPEQLATKMNLHNAQLALAHRYGFHNWPSLCARVSVMKHVDLSALTSEQAAVLFADSDDSTSISAAGIAAVRAEKLARYERGRPFRENGILYISEKRGLTREEALNDTAKIHDMPPVGTRYMGAQGTEWTVTDYGHFVAPPTMARYPNDCDYLPIVMLLKVSPRLKKLFYEVDHCTSKRVVLLDTMPAIHPFGLGMNIRCAKRPRVRGMIPDDYGRLPGHKGYNTSYPPGQDPFSLMDVANAHFNGGGATQDQIGGLWQRNAHGTDQDGRLPGEPNYMMPFPPGHPALPQPNNPMIRPLVEPAHALPPVFAWMDTSRGYMAGLTRSIAEARLAQQTAMHSPNLYVYVSNNPVSRTDPSGLFDSSWCHVFCAGLGPELYAPCVDACTDANDVAQLQQIWNKIRQRKRKCDNPGFNGDCFNCQGTGKDFRLHCEQCCDKLWDGVDDRKNTQCHDYCEQLSQGGKRPPGAPKPTGPKIAVQCNVGGTIVLATSSGLDET